MDSPLSTDPASRLSAETLDSISFERSQWTCGSVYADSFYNPLPSSCNISAPPGTVIVIEPHTDTSRYSLPPGISLSRIVYQSKTINSSSVPASACILWPFSPRTSGSPPYSHLVVWAHGTSGSVGVSMYPLPLHILMPSSITPNAAPSHMKNLWQHYLGPFALVLAGYVVLCPDYAGLGIPFSTPLPSSHQSAAPPRKPIVHHYLFTPEHALDTFTAISAARSTFTSRLAKSPFVVVGHSQGGGTSWACAALQQLEPMEGYLGTVAISPVSGLLAPVTGALVQCYDSVAQRIGPLVTPTWLDMYGSSGFKASDVLTPAGIEAMDQLQALGGCSASNGTVIEAAILRAQGGRLLKEGWNRNPHVRRFAAETSLAGAPIAGPMLVVQGDMDPLILCEATTKAVRATADGGANRGESIEYVVLREVKHNPACTAAQHVWIDWIRERFEGVKVEAGLKERVIEPNMGSLQMGRELSWWVAPAERAFHVP